MNQHENEQSVNIAEVPNKKSDRPFYLFFGFFIKKLKEDKLYAISFVITVLFITIFPYYKVRDGESFYKVHKDNTITEEVIPTVDTTLNKESVELDVSQYVGIYSKEYLLDQSIMLNDTCKLDKYKMIYQIKKDKKITKYLYNECLGTIKVWDDELKYVNDGGARYINAHKISFLFSNKSLKEVDGETYKLDENFNDIKENIKNKNYSISFSESDLNIMLMTNDNLINIISNKVSFNLKDKYTNNGGNLDTLVYKYDDKFYKFIIFNNGEEKNCYNDLEINGNNFIDGESYNIYGITFDFNSGRYYDVSLLTTRKKSDGCDLFVKDLEDLTE